MRSMYNLLHDDAISLASVQFIHDSACVACTAVSFATIEVDDKHTSIVWVQMGR